jgi:DNA-binding PadR family transcriptional regulator
MLDDPSRPWYGLEMAAASGLKSGTIYPLLARLERAGWLTSRWEDVDPVEAGRPRRRLYELTNAGYDAVRTAYLEHLGRLGAKPKRAPNPSLRPGGQPA